MLAFLKRVIAGRYRIMLKTEQGMVALSMCQSDPMVVPFGGTSNYFGTNPIAFAAPRAVMNQSCLIWLRQYRLGENFRCTFKRC